MPSEPWDPHNVWRAAIRSRDATGLAVLVRTHFDRDVDPEPFLKYCVAHTPGGGWSEATWRMWVKHQLGFAVRGGWALRDPNSDDEVPDLRIAFSTTLHVGFATLEENDDHLFFLRTYVPEGAGSRLWNKGGKEVDGDLIEPARSRLFRAGHHLTPIDRVAARVARPPSGRT